MKKLLIFVSIVLTISNIYCIGYNVLFRIPSGPAKNEVYYKYMENQYYFPKGLCTDGKYFYIGDIYKHRILVVDKSGSFINEIINNEFDNLEDIYYLDGFLWIKVINNYFETVSLMKYSLKGEFVFKIDPFNLKKVNKKIVDYNITKDGIYAVSDDDMCVLLDPETGDAKKIIPSFWFDPYGYYKLVNKKGKWILSIYSRIKGKLSKRINISCEKNRVLLLRKIDNKVLVQKFNPKDNKDYLYHFNKLGKVDAVIEKNKALKKYFDLKYILGYSHPKSDYIKVIEIR